MPVVPGEKLRVAYGVVGYALALTHVGWAVSLLLEPFRYEHKLLNPWFFAVLHVATASLLITGRRAAGGFISLVILLYYWLYVKPLEPIAEPQSVGILVISMALFTDRLFRRPDWNIDAALLRVGLAYPFVEWGADAFRNPSHFIAFMQSNYLTRIVFPTNILPYVTFSLGMLEVILAVLMLLGIATKKASITTFTVLTTFIIVAGYPLALPQNITLLAAAYVLYYKGPGEYTITSFSSFS